MKLHAHRSSRLSKYGYSRRVDTQGSGVCVEPLHDGTLVAKVLVTVKALRESEMAATQFKPSATDESREWQDGGDAQG